MMANYAKTARTIAQLTTDAETADRRAANTDFAPEIREAFALVAANSRAEVANLQRAHDARFCDMCGAHHGTHRTDDGTEFLCDECQAELDHLDWLSGGYNPELDATLYDDEEERPTECPACEGNGYHVDPVGHAYDCEDCDGTGSVAWENPTPQPHPAAARELPLNTHYPF